MPVRQARRGQEDVAGTASGFLAANVLHSLAGKVDAEFAVGMAFRKWNRQAFGDFSGRTQIGVSSSSGCAASRTSESHNISKGSEWTGLIGMGTRHYTGVPIQYWYPIYPPQRSKVP